MEAVAAVAERFNAVSGRTLDELLRYDAQPLPSSLLKLNAELASKARFCLRTRVARVRVPLRVRACACVCGHGACGRMRVRLRVSLRVFVSCGARKRRAPLPTLGADRRARAPRRAAQAARAASSVVQFQAGLAKKEEETELLLKLLRDVLKRAELRVRSRSLRSLRFVCAAARGGSRAAPPRPPPGARARHTLPRRPSGGARRARLATPAPPFRVPSPRHNSSLTHHARSHASHTLFGNRTSCTRC
jgi:hypothetical protein